MTLLDEHGDAIEADLLRFYQIDLLDFHRGTLSGRRLGVLIKQLPPEAALVRSLNNGRTPLSTTDNMLADLWLLTLHVNSDKNSPGSRVKDHPLRAEIQAQARAAEKNAKVIGMRAKFEQRKASYGLGVKR